MCLIALLCSVLSQEVNACHYGVAIGIMAFIIATGFFVADLIFPSISSAEKRKKIVMADTLFSGRLLCLFSDYSFFCEKEPFCNGVYLLNTVTVISTDLCWV